jgi:hypothetical protein
MRVMKFFGAGLLREDHRGPWDLFEGRQRYQERGGEWAGKLLLATFLMSST